MLSYIFVNDTEIYDRNTEPGISSYFSVYGRIRPWLFDLGCDGEFETRMGNTEERHKSIEIQVETMDIKMEKIEELLLKIFSKLD